MSFVAILLAAIFLFAAQTSGQELQAQPTDPVAAAPLPDAEGFAAAVLAASDGDPLHALVVSAERLTVEEAQELLEAAYDAYPTPTTRARAFGAAAFAASAAGRHDLALAWTDWALVEAESSPDRAMLLADRLADGIGVALAVGNPVLARSYVRRAAALAPGGRDDPAARAVVFARPGLVCPDVIADAWIRIAAAAADIEPGLLAAPSAECRYIPILGAPDQGFRVAAVRSLIGFEERFAEVVEQGLGASDVEARRVVADRLTGLDTRIEPLFLEGGERGALGFARRTRPGVNETVGYAYAGFAHEGVFLAVSAETADWAWPPESLGVRVEAGLEGVLAAGRSSE